MFKKIFEFYSKAVTFITRDIWRAGTANRTGGKAFWTKQLKIFLVSLKEFDKNNVNVQASSLTFYLMMTIVPIVAMVFAISKGFGIDEQLIDRLNETFPNQHDVVNTVLEFADSTIKNARGGLLAGIGFIVMLWSSMNMIVQIEECFNAIWKAKSRRSWSRRFADYLSVMLVVPVLLFLSTSLTVTFKYYLSSVTDEIPVLREITPLIFNLIPYMLVWILFVVLYMVMPNVKVRFAPALIAGIIAGTAFQLVEQFYFYSQISISKYNAIYGSLAAIPLFLLFAKISWQIVLFGAELSFAYQNIENYDLEIDSETLSNRNKVVLSLYVMECIVKNFAVGRPPKNSSQLASDLGLSIRAVNVAVSDLIRCGMLSEVRAVDDREYAYQPSMDIHRITIGSVLENLDNSGEGAITQQILPDMERIYAILQKVTKNFDENDGKLTFLEI